MPLYLYECGQGHKEYKKFGFNDRPPTTECGCGGVASFRFTSQIQLNTRPVHLSDNWRSPLSATDELAQTKEDMAAYERSWTPEPEDE